MILETLELEQLVEIAKEKVSSEMYYEFVDGVENAEKQDLINFIKCDGNYILESIYILADTYKGKDIPFAEIKEILDLYYINLERI